jgi:hypothetical protein
VAELSRISVFGSGGGAGGICTSWGSDSWVPDFCVSGWPAGEGCAPAAGCVVDGTVPVGAVVGVDGLPGGGLVVGSGVCGCPEPGLGVAGLFCAHPGAAQRSNKAIRAVGERCIEFQKLPIQTAKLAPSWMQRAATQMAGRMTIHTAQPERGICHPKDKQSFCPAAACVRHSLVLDALETTCIPDCSCY